MSFEQDLQKFRLQRNKEIKSELKKEKRLKYFDIYEFKDLIKEIKKLKEWMNTFAKICSYCKIEFKGGASSWKEDRRLCQNDLCSYYKENRRRNMIDASFESTKLYKLENELKTLKHFNDFKDSEQLLKVQELKKKIKLRRIENLKNIELESINFVKGMNAMGEHILRIVVEVFGK